MVWDRNMARLDVLHMLLITALCILQTTTRELAHDECLLSKDKFADANIVNHLLPATVKINSVIKLRCKETFYDRFTSTACVGKDNYKPLHPPCELVKCHSHGALKHGSNKGNSTSPEVARRYDVIHHICEEGYWYTGTPTQSCQRNGTWSGENGTCEEVQCSPPPPLDDGKYKEPPPYKYNNILTAECDEGYVYNGTDMRKCQGDNRWSGQEGICITIQAIQCNLKLQMDLYITGHYDQIKDFTCNKGYRYNGTQTRTCLANSTWSGTDGTCNRVYCRKPQVFIGNGWIVGCDRCEYRSRVKVLCEKGYEHNGTGLVCNEDGNWNGTIGHCQEIRCTAPNKLPNGNISISGLSYKSIGNVTCNRNYWLFGNNEVRCQDDGTWSKPGSCIYSFILLITAGICLAFVIISFLFFCFIKIRKRRARHRRMELKDKFDSEQEMLTLTPDGTERKPPVAEGLLEPVSS